MANPSISMQMRKFWACMASVSTWSSSSSPSSSTAWLPPPPPLRRSVVLARREMQMPCQKVMKTTLIGIDMENDETTYSAKLDDGTRRGTNRLTP